MSHHANRLAYASGIFFFVGFAAAQLHFGPLVFITIHTRFLSLLAYFIAYSLWFAGCQFYPNQFDSGDEWYNFAQFKHQHTMAAVLGMLAVVCGISAFFFPPIALAASWLYVLSNCLWLISEYHKKENPSLHGKEYSGDQQSTYLTYAKLVTTMTLITAIATTIAILAPTFAVTVIILTGAFSIGLGSLAFIYWVDYTFGDYVPDNQNVTNTQNNSYDVFRENELVRSAESRTELTSSTTYQPNSIPKPNPYVRSDNTENTHPSCQY